MIKSWPTFLINRQLTYPKKLTKELFSTACTLCYKNYSVQLVHSAIRRNLAVLVIVYISPSQKESLYIKLDFFLNAYGKNIRSSQLFKRWVVQGVGQNGCVVRGMVGCKTILKY